MTASTPSPLVTIDLSSTPPIIPPNLQILLCTENELPHLISIQYAACEDYPFHLAVWGPNTPTNRAAAADRLLTKWRANPDTMCVVKCVLSKPEHRNDSTSSGDATNESGNDQMMIAWCIWSIYRHSQAREQALAEDSMNDCSWLSDTPVSTPAFPPNAPPTDPLQPQPYPGVSPRALARAYLIPCLHARWDILQGRPHAYLTNLVTDPRHRGKGAGTKLVEWGIEEARRRLAGGLSERGRGGVCYMEASDLGKGVYERLEFRVVGSVRSVVHVEEDDGGGGADGDRIWDKKRGTREVLVDESPVLVRDLGDRWIT